MPVVALAPTLFFCYFYWLTRSCIFPKIVTHRQTCWATSECVHSDCFSLFGIVSTFCGSDFGTIQPGLGWECHVLLSWPLLGVNTSQLLKYNLFCSFRGAKWTALKAHFCLQDLPSFKNWTWVWKSSSLYYLCVFFTLIWLSWLMQYFSCLRRSFSFSLYFQVKWVINCICCWDQCLAHFFRHILKFQQLSCQESLWSWWLQQVLPLLHGALCRNHSYINWFFKLRGTQECEANLQCHGSNGGSWPTMQQCSQDFILVNSLLTSVICCSVEPQVFTFRGLQTVVFLGYSN